MTPPRAIWLVALRGCADHHRPWHYATRREARAEVRRLNADFLWKSHGQAEE